MLGRSIIAGFAGLAGLVLCGAALAQPYRDPRICGEEIVINALDVKEAGRGGQIYLPKGCRKIALPEGYRWGEMSKEVVSIKDSRTNETIARFVMNQPPAKPEAKAEIVTKNDQIQVWEEGRKVGTVTYSEEGGK